MALTDLHLYTAWYCPYAQRTWAFIEHLGLPYRNIDVDPYVKSPEWMKVSRGQGTVPVVQVSRDGDTGLSVPGSLESMEYLADVKPEAQAFSSDPLKRADQKYWLGHIDRKITSSYYGVLTKPAGSAESDAARQDLEAALLQLIEGAPLGQWFSGGEQPGVLDFALAPFALRMALLFPHYRDYALPETTAPWQAYADWADRMTALPAFIASAPDQNTYRDRLLGYYASYVAGQGHQGA